MSPDSREAKVSYGNRTLPGSRESGDEAINHLAIRKNPSECKTLKNYYKGIASKFPSNVNMPY